MSKLRTTATHVAGGLVLSVALFGCDSTNTVTAPQSSGATGILEVGTLFSPMQIPVEIHAIFSGPPNRDPGIIHIDDPDVFVQVLNIQQFLPRQASPGDVGIGDDWETSTKAQDFTILDINNDGVLDIQLRFDTQELITNGDLVEGTQTLTVWGRDPVTLEEYSGEYEVEVIGPGMPQPCFWDNGAFHNAGMITHPNGGTGPIAGQHVSMSDPVHNTAGSNVLLSGVGPHFRVADDFHVEQAAGCILSEVITHAYRTGGPPNWASANLNLRSDTWDGPIVATATTTTWEFTGIYRTFNAVLNNADRPIHRLRFTFDNITLDEGIYWIDWQVVGGTSAWANYLMRPPNPPGANNPLVVFQNGRQMTVGGVWQPLLDPPGAETPFYVLGPGASPPPPASRPVSVGPLALPRDYSTWTEDRAH